MNYISQYAGSIIRTWSDGSIWDFGCQWRIWRPEESEATNAFDTPEVTGARSVLTSESEMSEYTKLPAGHPVTEVSESIEASEAASEP